MKCGTCRVLQEPHAQHTPSSLPSTFWIVQPITLRHDAITGVLHLIPESSTKSSRLAIVPFYYSGLLLLSIPHMSAFMMDNTTWSGSHHEWETLLQKDGATAFPLGQPSLASSPFSVGIAAMTPPPGPDSPSEQSQSQLLDAAARPIRRSARIAATPPPEPSPAPQNSQLATGSSALTTERRLSLAATHPSQYDARPDLNYESGSTQGTRLAHQGQDEQRIPGQAVTREQGFLPDILISAPSQTDSPREQSRSAPERISDSMLMPPPPRPPKRRHSLPPHPAHRDRSQQLNQAFDENDPARAQYTDPTYRT